MKVGKTYIVSTFRYRKRGTCFEDTRGGTTFGCSQSLAQLVNLVHTVVAPIAS